MVAHGRELCARLLFVEAHFRAVPGWRLVLVGHRVLSVEGGSVDQSGAGAYVTPDDGVEQLTVHLDGKA